MVMWGGFMTEILLLAAWVPIAGFALALCLESDEDVSSPLQ